MWIYICVFLAILRPSWIANQGIDSVGAGARNNLSSGVTASNTKFSNQS